VVSETVAAAGGEGRDGKGPGSTCGTALLLTYNSPSHTYTSTQAHMSGAYS